MLVLDLLREGVLKCMHVDGLRTKNQRQKSLHAFAEESARDEAVLGSGYDRTKNSPVDLG